MTRPGSYIICLIIVVFCCGCGNRGKVEKIYEEFVKDTISFPAEMLCVDGTNKSMKPLGGKEIKFVYYIDSTECTSCSISHLSAFNKLIDLSVESDKFDFLIIFSPKIRNAESLIGDLMVFEYDFPIFIDTMGEFRNLNPRIPPGGLFHQFLLNSDNCPAFVGSPLMSPSMASLFKRTLEELGIE